VIAFLRGTLALKEATRVVVDCRGVGYSAAVSVRTSEALPEQGAEVLVHTHLSVREDAHELFGFADESERKVFMLLISISGIGPKSALGILSSVAPAELASVVARGDIGTLQKFPGIGKKTAERIVVELRDKMHSTDFGSGADHPEASLPAGVNEKSRQEAVLALVALGYARTSAEKAVATVLKDPDNLGLSTDKIIRKALRAV
jgi:Holliday junction DNA helicase RuvA